MKFLKMLSKMLIKNSQNRVAKELLIKLPEEQLNNLNISKSKLKMGASGYPWNAVENVIEVNSSINLEVNVGEDLGEFKEVA